MSERERRAKAVTKLTPLHEDGSIDRAFWKCIPPERRLELLWDLTLEYAEWQGTDGAQSRLQKSVHRVQRRPS